jgi:hypothetical protein
MLKRVRNLALVLPTVFFLSAPLIGQDQPNQEAKEKVDPGLQALEIIKLAESKLYSPVSAGLKDLQFIHKTALRNQYRTFWFKAPNRFKAIYGRGKAKPKKESASSKLFKNLEPEIQLPQSIVHRSLGRLLGKPLTCLLPFGTFEIIKKDESGTQLRFTAKPDDPSNLVWTHIDFYLDPNFQITKSMQKLVPDGRIEEFRIKLKPYKKDAELLVIDSEVIMAGTDQWQTTSTGVYEYAQYGDYWLIKQVEWNVHEKDEEKYLEEYLNYKIDEGIDPAVFKGENKK